MKRRFNPSRVKLRSALLFRCLCNCFRDYQVENWVLWSVGEFLIDQRLRRISHWYFIQYGSQKYSNTCNKRIIIWNFYEYVSCLLYKTFRNFVNNVIKYKCHLSTTVVDKFKPCNRKCTRHLLQAFSKRILEIFKILRAYNKCERWTHWILSLTDTMKWE